MEDITPTPETSVDCDVNHQYYPHLFLLPAGIIITILAFLRRRRSFRKDIWKGRPGVVVPIDFFGMDHNRLSVVCVFGAATGSIVDLAVASPSILGFQDTNAWGKAFLLIATCVEIALLYYPHFGCLTSYHTVIGALMGVLYATVFFLVSLTATFQKCKEFTTFGYAVMIVSSIPQILCHLFIVGKFILVLYKEIKEYGLHRKRFFSEDEQSEVKLTSPWLKDYVRELINSEPAPQYSGMQFYLRKIYNPNKNFKFSTQTLSVFMICFIILYSITTILLISASRYLDQINQVDDPVDKFNEWIVRIFRWIFSSLIGASILAAIFCVISLTRFMENHKNNMLRMFKGDKSFIPRTINMQSQFVIGKALRFHCFQIGFFLWGYVLLLLLFWVILIFFHALPHIWSDIVDWFKGGGVLMFVAVLTYISMLAISATVFRDNSFPRNVVSIDNRNAYLVFSYFWFFVGLPMGFFAAILRILKALLVGALMLPRIDHSVMPDGFQWLDKGFNAYICYLHVQTSYRNPILRVFCQLLNDETRNKTEKKCRCSTQARARWFLALTLARNPQLASERKPIIQSFKPVQLGYLQHGDIEIQVGSSGV